MGARGPAGKRSDERVRRNEPTIPVKKIDVAKLIPLEVEIPEPDPKWHATARNLYDSFAYSAQSVYYEPSDWALLYTGCENLSRQLKPQYVGQTFEASGESHSVMKRIPLKGSDMAALLKLMTMLGATEADRRRNGIEIERAIHAEDLSGVNGSAQVYDLFANRDEALGG